MLMRCALCSGTGAVPCPRCCSVSERESVMTEPPSEGIFDLPEEKGARTRETEPPRCHSCELCGGSGRQPCQGCLGTGYVDFPAWA